MSILKPDGTTEDTEPISVSGDSEPGSGRRGRKAYPRDAEGRIIRPDGSVGPKAQGTTRTRVNLEAQIEGFLQLINMIVRAYKPDMALDQVESVALTKAINQQCQTSPKFRRYVEKFLASAGGVNLMGVVVVIAARRVARANLIPLPSDSPVSASQIDDMCGAILYASTGGKPITTMQVPAS